MIYLSELGMKTSQRIVISILCLLFLLPLVTCGGKDWHPVDPSAPRAGSVCGNGICDLGETKANCPQDCQQTTCGDHRCEGSEDQLSCPEDCGTDPTQKCGNLICEPGENMLNCPQDCKN